MKAQILAIALLAVPAAGVASAQTSNGSPTPPEGVMTLYAGTSSNANFLIDASIVREGQIVRFSNLRIYGDPIAVPGGPVGMSVESIVLDCGARTAATESIETFRADGGYIRPYPGDPAGPIEANSTWDFSARVLCDGFELPPTQKRTGWRAAREVAVTMMARAG